MQSGLASIVVQEHNFLTHTDLTYRLSLSANLCLTLAWNNEKQAKVVLGSDKPVSPFINTHLAHSINKLHMTHYT